LAAAPPFFVSAARMDRRQAATLYMERAAYRTHARPNTSRTGAAMRLAAVIEVAAAADRVGVQR
jgi:hypothetical protein